MMMMMMMMIYLLRHLSEGQFVNQYLHLMFIPSGHNFTLDYDGMAVTM